MTMVYSMVVLEKKRCVLMNKIRFGIVGTGNIAHRFAQAVKNVPKAKPHSYFTKIIGFYGFSYIPAV